MKRSITPIRGGGTRFRLNKKMISATLGVTLALGMNSIAFAEEQEPNKVYHNITSEGESITTGKSDMTVETIEFQDQSYLIAEVPLEIPVVFDTQGNMTAPDEILIVNLSDRKLQLIGTKVTPSTNFSSGYTSLVTERGGPNVFGIKILSNIEIGGGGNIDKTPTTKNLSSNNIIIDANSQLDLDFEIVFGDRSNSEAHDKISFGTIEFTIAFVD